MRSSWLFLALAVLVLAFAFTEGKLCLIKVFNGKLIFSKSVIEQNIDYRKVITKIYY